jgi:S-DNA-T family DNA segregation ATPase FtsK/SpoIIIE
MTQNDLIGKVAVAYLKRELDHSDPGGGTARFLLNSLSSDQTASIALSILADDKLSEGIEIKLPRKFVTGHGLPEDVLTDRRTTYFRNADCLKRVLLVANTGDDEGQSLRELVSIDADVLMGLPTLWIESLESGQILTDEQKKWWTQALRGLLDSKSLSLDQFARYLYSTDKAIVQEGQPILQALGYALPELSVFRDTGYFTSLKSANAGHRHQWRNLYGPLFKKRACYLRKQTPAQSQLTEEDLVQTWVKVKDNIPEIYHGVIESFISSQSFADPVIVQMATLEWPDVCPLFDGLKKEKISLGEMTHQFYDERSPELLSSEEKDYVDRLRKSKSALPRDEDIEFYQAHESELKEDRSLKRAWDRFILGAPIETEDFLQGLVLCMESLFPSDCDNYAGTKRKLIIRCERNTKYELKELNYEAGLFFVTRYRGIKGAFGREKHIEWQVGELFNFSEVAGKWKNAAKPFTNTSRSKSAMRLEFTLALELTRADGNQDNGRFKKLIWVFNPDGIASEFANDVIRLSKHPFVTATVSRETNNAKGRIQAVNLANVSTLRPAYDQDRGTLVRAYKPADDVAKRWRANLIKAEEDKWITKETAEKLDLCFKKFENSYSRALMAFLDRGVFSEELPQQASAFTELLKAICSDARGDLNREYLLRPLMTLGVIPVEGGGHASIIAPWQPLRFAAIAHKARLASSLISHLLVAKTVCFGDTKLFFREMKNDLAHPFYPDVTLVWDQNEAHLLSLSDWYQDYSLQEEPFAKDETGDETNENPVECAKRILEVTERYTSLYPHERANLGIVLYNCDCARLPQEVVEKLGEWQEERDEDIRCQVVLRHRENVKLQKIYETIIASGDSDADSFVASEATRDFMARLRIGIMADQAAAPRPEDGPEQDLVILQDVIARKAKLDWLPETPIVVPFGEWVPTHWMRRRPSATDDLRSVSYLVCPAQSIEGWNYLNAVTSFFKSSDNIAPDKVLLPARKLDFNDAETSSIFKEVHELGNWVVNYDELLDKRQLQNLGVSVIRYKQTETQGRNMVVSSQASLELLRSMILQRLRDLELGLSEEDLSGLASRFIQDAKELSGDIVLRATKRSRNASELIGVVLSRYLLRHELKQCPNIGWYFLDDYAVWLGQKEGLIADLLAIAPETTADGRVRLSVIVSEAKYISYESHVAKQHESRQQLCQSVRRVSEALFGDPGRLDRDLWLSRFSDLMVNGIQFPTQTMPDLARWRKLVRDGECEIYLRGYSHVFVSGPHDSPECSEALPIAECSDCLQEMYSRDRLKDLVRSYHANTVPPRIVDTESGIQNLVYRQPSPRIVIGRVKNSLQDKDLDSTDIESVQSDLATDKRPSVESSTGDSGSDNGITDKTASEEVATPKDEAETDTPISQIRSRFEGVRDLICKDVKYGQDSVEDAEWLKQTTSQTRLALQGFQLQSKLLDQVLTPNAALLKFQGSANLTVDQVKKRRQEFLTTYGLNIVGVRAEPGKVAISIARPKRRVLTLAEVWKDWSPDCLNGNTELLIAQREEDGTPLLFSPMKNAPHTLIAGGTGSGKSVLMQNILLGITATNTPEQAQIILIDPKMVDFTDFEKVPHLRESIITDQTRSLQVLTDAVREMDRRYEVLRTNKVKDIVGLRRKGESATEQFPVLWIIHDEFAEWMLTETYQSGVSDIVSRLGVKARAAGIYLVFAAQRPDATVMPMQLRDNLGNRLVLKVNSEGTSDIALGESGAGAERLLGRGHLMAKLDGELGITVAQVPFVDDASVSLMLSKLCE